MSLLDFLFKPTQRRTSVSTESETVIKQEWETIRELLRGRQPSQLRQGLIAADKTLDRALRDISEGETMGERLKNAEIRFSKDLYNKIWEAHKIRNSLVHEAGFEPPYFVLTAATESLRQALVSLGVLV